MAKLPSINFYPGDWLRDPISGCSLAAQGLWLRMMMLMHDSERYGYICHNGLPIRPATVALRCGCKTPDQYESLLAELDANGIPSRTQEGIIYSRRMVRDAKVRDQGRRYGLLGGNPALVGVNHPDKGGLNPALKEKLQLKSGIHSGEGVEGGIPETLQTEYFLLAWADWLDFRKEIKKPVTPTMAKKQLRQMEKWGEAHAVETIENTITHGWWGLREPEIQGANSRPRDETPEERAKRVVAMRKAP